MAIVGSVQPYPVDKELSRDVAIPEEFNREKGIFEYFSETTLAEVRTDIKPGDYDCVVCSMASSTELPEELHLAILEGKYLAKSAEEVTSFHFQLGEMGECVYGCFVLKKNPNGNIDLGYSVCILEFELSSVPIPCEKPKKILGIQYGKKQSLDYRHRSLSRDVQDELQLYCRVRGLVGFRDICRFSKMLEIKEN